MSGHQSLEATSIRRRRVWGAAALGLALVLYLGAGSWALLNPNFTPLDVHRGATQILSVKAQNPDPKATALQLKVGAAIKGKAPEGDLRIDFTKALAGKDGQTSVEDLVDLFAKSVEEPAMLAIGDLEGKRSALMHVNGTWARLSPGADATTWQFEKLDNSLRSTYNGGTDMLIETMRFIQKFPGTAVMKCTGGVQSESQEKLGNLNGPLQALLSLDVNGDGKLDLHALCNKGDLLWIQKAGKFEVLKSWNAKSQSAAWADFNGDGRVDCALLDETGALQLCIQQEGLTFAAQKISLPGAKDDWNAVHAFSPRVGTPAWLVVSGKGQPLILQNKSTGALVLEPLPQAGLKLDAELAGPCAVSDFDNDGQPDILQIYQKNAVLYRGKADGSFNGEPNCGAFMGKVKERQLTVADLDGDGRLDLLLSGGESSPLFFHNFGGKFKDVSHLTGESSYIIQPGSNLTAAADFNNDTFLDLFAGYSAEKCQFFFNRGFRSFAFCESLNFSHEDAPDWDKGQSAAVWGDFDGDGAQDLAFALQNGAVYLGKTTLGSMTKPTGIRVRLAPAAKFAGPLRVTYWREGQCLGARQTSAFGEPATIGLTEAAKYEVRWQLPSQPEVTRTVEVTNKFVDLVVGE